MTLNPQNLLYTNPSDLTEVLNPSEIIALMIEFRFQLSELEQQIQILQPAFFAACVALNTERIALERATISRRLTPGQWVYSPDIVTQEDLLKQLKRQFQQTHEPSGGREIVWALKLLLTNT